MIERNPEGWTFDPVEHRYWNPQGVKVSGITSILKAGGLLDDMGSFPSSMRKGVRVHQAIQFDIEGDLDESSVSPDEIGFVIGARKAIKTLGLDIIGAEVLKGHDEYQYATKIDAEATWEDAFTTVNWKTGRNYPWYAVQSAAEAMLYKTPCRRLDVFLTKAGNFKYEEFKDPSDFERFKECLAKRNIPSL